MPLNAQQKEAYTAEQINALFSRKLDSSEDKEKLAEYGSAFVLDRLREATFCRMIFPPQPCKRSDLQISMVHDTMVKIVFMEPNSQAMTVSFREQVAPRYYRADRFEAPFFEIGSERYEKTEEELAVYNMPITDIIRKNVIKDIGEIEDYQFLAHAESAVQGLQKNKQGLGVSTLFVDATAFTAFNVESNAVTEHGKFKAHDVLNNTTAATAAAGVTESLETPVQKDDLIKLAKAFPGYGGQGSRLRMDCFLMSETDQEELNAWTISDVGDQILKETAINGWKSDQVIGRKYIRTIKTDILRPGNIYAFAHHSFVGGMCIWNGIKFYADKERNRISFEAWENLCMYFANIAGVRKLELYAGSSDLMSSGATSNASVLARYAPFNEDDLGAQNHLVDKGFTFPAVSEF